MKWAVKIGRIAGIDVQIHVTFLILVAYVIFQHYRPRGDWGDVVSGLVLTAALFVIVVLHELGHALAARHYGIRTRDITLLPIGGVARLERMPEDPKQELVVALAGPAVNVVLAVLLAAFLVPAAALSTVLDFHLVGGGFLATLLAANILMAGFNLIPAFPMDGGRVLRALLALKMEYVSATNVAATVGQGAALLFGFWGLMQGAPLMAFVALFVWIAASQEASMVQMRAALGGIPIARAMITDYQTLHPADTLTRAVDHTLAGFQQDFPVVDEGGRVVGILTRGRLLGALAQGGDQGSVGDVMEREFSTTDPYEMADRAFARLSECQCHALPVTLGGRLVGIVTPENVGEFLMIQSALHGAARARPAA